MLLFSLKPDLYTVAVSVLFGWGSPDFDRGVLSQLERQAVFDARKVRAGVVMDVHLYLAAQQMNFALLVGGFFTVDVYLA